MAFQKKFFWICFAIAFGLMLFGFLSYNLFLYKVFSESAGIIIPIFSPGGLVLYPAGQLLSGIPPGSEHGDKVFYLALVNFVIWIGILAYPFKKLFLEERENKWWHYVLGILVLQGVIVLFISVLVTFALKDFTIG